MKQKLIIILCAAYSSILYASNSSEAQLQNVYKEPELKVYSFLTNIPKDYVAVTKSIFSKESITPFLWVVGSTGVLIKYDYETYQPFKKKFDSSKDYNDLVMFGWDLGKGGAQYAIAGGFLASGIAFGSHKALRTASQIAEVVLATGITTQTLKHMTGRESPCCTDITPRTGMWRFFVSPKRYHTRVSAHDAFPSGHIATTFATARVIEINYPEQKWIPYVSYPVIAFVGLSMVSSGGHWWSDYPLSLFLGYHFSKAVTRGNPEVQEKDSGKDGISYDLFPTKGGLGLAFTKQLF